MPPILIVALQTSPSNWALTDKTVAHFVDGAAASLDPERD